MAFTVHVFTYFMHFFQQPFWTPVLHHRMKALWAKNIDDWSFRSFRSGTFNRCSNCIVQNMLQIICIKLFNFRNLLKMMLCCNGYDCTMFDYQMKLIFFIIAYIKRSCTELDLSKDRKHKIVCIKWQIMFYSISCHVSMW
jgi:hypothetical protein